ncbi:MAG: phosphatase PAP2 family protein [Clostridia bacterium]|nr:phosphatase PAP2 family protein [Clostridia bacterium]
MKTENQKNVCLAICLLAAFLLWTLAIQWIDVQVIGPCGSSVGFASLNGYIHTLTGVHMSLYTITDWLGLVPIAVAAGFGILGLIQWIRRKHILLVDHSLLVLGGFYLVVMAVYVLFERVVVNYRPVYINGYLEASYPSSTTMLVLCVMPTAVMQFQTRIRNKLLRRWIASVITAFAVFMVTGRFVSGVHWFTDIIGGALLSAGLVLLYRTVVR